ncbi:hypothetical protein XF35_24975 [Streptomyces platensis subsp. clarensis]|nr:hypothetical protein [Streptomyces platensis subsp. clarensis]
MWDREILARRLLDAEDAAPDDIHERLTRLVPGHAGTAALYLVEHEYLHTPSLAPAPDTIKTWNQELHREELHGEELPAVL